MDGSRSPFDQLAEIMDAVGDKIDVMIDGGVRGTHVLKALSLGAKAVGLGRYYLFPLAVAGQASVERALALMRAEIERDMRLMGCRSVSGDWPLPKFATPLSHSGMSVRLKGFERRRCGRGPGDCDDETSFAEDAFPNAEEPGYRRAPA